MENAGCTFCDEAGLSLQVGLEGFDSRRHEILNDPTLRRAQHASFQVEPGRCFIDGRQPRLLE
jgi:hypothetical protein